MTLFQILLTAAAFFFLFGVGVLMVIHAISTIFAGILPPALRRKRTKKK